MAARIIIRIDVTPAAKAGLDQCADRLGMTQVTATSRLMEWLAKQHPGVQAAVLGQYPKAIEAEVAQMLMDHLKLGQKQ